MIVSRMNQLIGLMKTETLDGTRIIDKPVFRDRVMKIQGRVMAFQNHGLRLLSARLNNRKDAMFGVMILKLIGTELRHELEGLAIDVMGELGTLYEDSPNLRDNGSWQFAYMMYFHRVQNSESTLRERHLQEIYPSFLERILALLKVRNT